VLAPAACAAVLTGVARAAEVRALYVRGVGYAGAGTAPDDGPGLRGFEQAARAVGAAPVELVEIAGGPAPRAPVALEAGSRAIAELRFEEAQRALDAAAAEAVMTGGAGLTATELDDLFLLRGVSELKLGESARVRAWDDFVRAALLAPERVLDAGRFSPSVLETWRRAVAEVQRRARGVLVVRAPPGARVVVDDRAAVPSPAAVPGLAYGEHYVRVEEPGRVPWSTLAVLAAPTLELDVPARAVLALDDRSAAARARRAGAAFALVATPAGAAATGEPLLEIALVRAADDSRRDSAIVRAGDDGQALAHAAKSMIAAETARSAAAARATAPPLGPAPAEARPSFLARRWPLLVAAAAVVGAAVTIGIVASGSGRAGSGFSVSADPGGLGR
jgi:hypothetical protein